MAINRAPFNALVDDDGSGAIGSVWNKAAIQGVLLDPVDAAMAGTLGTWTPVDNSGAGLVFAGVLCNYVKVGLLVHVHAQFSYPATANAAPAQITGLPFAALNGGHGGLYTTFGQVHILHVPANNQRVHFYDGTGGVRTNAALSGALILFAGSYICQTP